jgi:thiol-disulfide isomerase/thioredoxin
MLASALLISGLQAGEQQSGPAEAVPKWRIVNYWSEWCGPCRREIPILNELNAQLASSGSVVTVVGVNFDEDPRDETMAIAERMGIEFPTLTLDAVNELRLKSPSVLPTTYILSPENLVVAKLIGEQNEASLTAQIDQLNLTGEAQ